MSTATELWQTEWCPASHRVRQRLTELGLSYVAHQVPVEPEARLALRQATGQTSVPVLISAGRTIVGEEAIVRHLNDEFTEPAEAQAHREKAIKAKRKELERACLDLTTAATH